MAANLYEADLRYFYSDRYTSAPEGAPGVKSAAAAHLKRGFTVIEDALEQGPFLCGATQTIADTYLAMLIAWSPEPIASPRLRAASAAVTRDPMIEPLWRRHGLDK